MKSKILVWLLLCVVFMIMVPWLAVSFLKGDAGMAVCFFLFYALYPLFATILGMVSGRNIRRMWFMPFIAAILFLIGAWIFFDINELAFIMYAGIYLIIGIIVMLLSVVVRKKNK